MSEQSKTVSTFSSAAVAMNHPHLGNLEPGWNHGVDREKLQVVYDAQREPGVVNTLHPRPVACKRDADGFVWNDAANDFVDPKKLSPVAAAKATPATPEPPALHKTPDAPESEKDATSPGSKLQPAASTKK